MRATEIAKKIDKLFTKHLYGELGDYSIYYRNKAIKVNTSTGKKIVEDTFDNPVICPTEYKNEKGVTVVYDGEIYNLMNDGYYFEGDESLGIPEKHNWNLVNELDELLKKYNCWYENGNPWNFAVYED